MRKLILPRKGHLQRNSERFDGHDGDRTGGGADGEVNERVLLAVLWRDLVNHEDGEDGYKNAVYEEA